MIYFFVDNIMKASTKGDLAIKGEDSISEILKRGLNTDIKPS